MPTPEQKEELRAQLTEMIRPLFGSLDNVVNGPDRPPGLPQVKLPDGGIGIALLMFDFGPDGAMVYACNAARPDMIRALRELVDNLERG